MLDWTHAGPSLVAAFLASLVEFVEALTVVLAVGVVRGWRPALLGTGFGLAALFLLGVVLHRPLASIPENTLKFVVGVLLSAFGTFWVGEGIGAAWPESDWSILALIVGFLVLALVMVPLCRARSRAAVEVVQ